MLNCPYCGSPGHVTESPWALPWVALRDPRAQGGKIAVDCTVCGFEAKAACYSAWPTATGHIITRDEARAKAFENFAHGIKRRQLEKP